MRPGEFWATFGAWIGTAIAMCVLGAVILGVGWKAGWWLQEKAANNSYRVTQNSQSYQQTYLQEVNTGFSNLNKDQRQLTVDQASGNTTLIGEDKVELASDAGYLCQYGENLDQQTINSGNLTAFDLNWYQVNCNSGVVSPTSQYFIKTASSTG